METDILIIILTVLGSRAVTRLITTLEARKPEIGRQYCAAADIAAAEDFTVVVVLDAETSEMVWMERFNRVDYPILESRLQALYKRWHLKSLTVEVNGVGRGVIDHLRAEGLNIVSFQTNQASKQALIQKLQMPFEQEAIRVLNDPVLKLELLNFEARQLPSGAFQYRAPAGMHDDCVMALALAWDSLTGQERRFKPLVIMGEDPVREMDAMKG